MKQMHQEEKLCARHTHKSTKCTTQTHIRLDLTAFTDLCKCMGCHDPSHEHSHTYGACFEAVVNKLLTDSYYLMHRHAMNKRPRNGAAGRHRQRVAEVQHLLALTVRKAGKHWKLNRHLKRLYEALSIGMLSLLPYSTNKSHQILTQIVDQFIIELF